MVFITRKTWTYILEEEYQQIKTYVGNALPKISLATIKTDANSKLQWSKYLICVLGNLDPTNWSRNKVFAPFILQLELRLLITIAVQKNSKVNARDFKQEFFSYTCLMVRHMCYVLLNSVPLPPPPPPNTYIHLIQTDMA